MRKLSIAFILAIAVLTIVPLIAQDETPVFEPYFEERPCTMPAPQGVEMSCGFMYVLQDRLNPDPKKIIRLSVVILHSLSDTPKPDPIINLTGGPGGIATPYVANIFRDNYRTFLEDRDFIIFDQRGVGNSIPSLDCPPMLEASYAAVSQTGSYEQLNAAETAAILICHDLGVENNFDLNGYTSVQNATDVEELRIALGYDKWNLFGVSYGTRLALTIMRDFPDGIRSVILDSSYPLQVDLYTDLAANKQRAFDTLFAACNNDTACSENYPNLEGDFYTIVEQINTDPVFVRGRHFSSNQPFEAYVSGSLIAEEVFSMFYIKEQIAAIPFVVDQIAQEDYRILPWMVQDLLNQSEGISEGMYFSIQCHEEVSFMNRAAMIESAEILHPSLRDGHIIQLNGILDICDAWNINHAQALENEPVISDIPTLILSGQFDPITPPAWGKLVHNDMENSFFYTIPSVGHGIVRSHTCAMDISGQFINAPTIEPDASCIDDILPVEFMLPEEQ